MGALKAMRMVRHLLFGLQSITFKHNNNRFNPDIECVS
jgi:hypothetical protein